MKRLSYKESGVDIEKSKKFIKRIKPLSEISFQKGVVEGIGGFASLFKVPKRYKEPIIVAGTDGVGTKLLLAQKLSSYKSIGIDLVAMCVNDIICQGAKPLFFLDYLAVGELKGKREEDIIRGIIQGCQKADCALLGGETAQMRDLYGKDGFDLAGTAVGIVEKRKVIDGSRIKEGDIILGLASSGLHSNGFSLVRKVLKKRNLRKYEPLLGKRLGDELLQPTRIYVRPIHSLIKKVPIKGIANITGGGLIENIGRILPEGKRAIIKKGTWPTPSIFKFIQKEGKISEKEMELTFNLGIGMVIILSPEDIERAKKSLLQKRVSSFVIGEIEKNATGEKVSYSSFPN